MKKTLFLTFTIIAALMLGLSSCVKDAKTDSSKGDNVLVIKLPKAATRAIEDQVAGGAIADVDVISNVEIFLINTSSGAVVNQASFTSDEIKAGYKRIEQVDAAVSKVVAIANIPNGVLATVKALASYTAIKGYDFTSASQNAGLGEIDDKTMMGEGTPVSATDPDPAHDATHTYKEVNIDLDAITARFEIGAVKPGVGVASVELVGVWINNFYTGSQKTTLQLYPAYDPMWNTTPSATPNYTAPVGAVSVATYGYPEYYDAANNTAGTGVTLNASSKVYAYHVFPSSDLPHLILLVKGEYDDGYFDDTIDPAEKYFLKWVTFTNYKENGVSIGQVSANYIYKVGVGATGIAINAGDLTETPELGQFDLGINLTITPWTAKTVTPEVQ